jgi:hypothetical protein
MQTTISKKPDLAPNPSPIKLERGEFIEQVPYPAVFGWQRDFKS